VSQTPKLCLWAPGKDHKIWKSVILWPVTPWILVVVYFWREKMKSGMSFRRDDCTGTDVSGSVLCLDVREAAARVRAE
jgi:hypothetical protein